MTLDPFHVDCAARVKDGDNPGPDAQRLSGAQLSGQRRGSPGQVSARPSNPAMEFSGKIVCTPTTAAALNGNAVMRMV